ncbi:hypothetical protein Enr13x_51610 [Stieleria neptunia]|uniref:Uncharacterized protein n=1 Tax=Stieleria neptunia TaxID=2527979 RepID=A0A518HWP7_9BACT|nr:hypothetical protein [Stieleria neptunia]QDV45285.1 hypothetical protein Enr13x_51610 [Stieleria neptunia]
MASSRLKRSRIQIENLENRIVMTGISVAQPPLIELDTAAADITDVYFFAISSAGDRSSGSPFGQGPAIKGDVPAASTPIEPGDVDAILASQVDFSRHFETASNANSASAVLHPGASTDMTTGNAAAEQPSESSFESALAELQESINSLSPTDNMIANDSKTRHDAAIQTVLSAY